jgi:peptidoglycan/LPS O-acetylase OafA/YrhL
MNNNLKKFSYRKDIDGLRFIAIATVLFFHAELGISGGFVGVDIFFVISGFLITSLIYKELILEKFTFINFWERRARRIAPALITVVFFILIAGWLILLPKDYKNLGTATIFQSLFSANIYSYLDSNYFSGASTMKPLLHMWSLAVEEQFYLFGPAILWLLVKFRKTAKTIVVILIILTLLSLLLSSVGVFWKPSATFYLLPTRAWEMLIGAILAIAPPQYIRINSHLTRNLLSFLGLSLIMFASFTYTESTPFPGLLALAPVIGTALIIHCNLNEKEGTIDTFVGKMLSWRPIVFFGLISYSLYLWHWPIIVYTKHVLIGPLTTPIKFFAVFISIVFAIISWKFIENPFRDKKLAKGLQIYTWAAGGLSVLALFGLFIYVYNGVPSRWSEQVNRYDNARNERSYRIELPVSAPSEDKLYRIGVKDKSIAPSTLVWGDSHAMSVMAAFDKFFQNHQIAGVGATHSSTSPVLEWYRLTPYGLREKSPIYNQGVFDYILRHKIKNVFLVGAWSSMVGDDSSGLKDSVTFESALVDTINLLRDAHINVWLMLDVPHSSYNIPSMLARATINSESIEKYSPKPNEINYTDNLDESILKQINSTGSYILNPKSAFLSDNGDHYIIEKNNDSLYFDEHHLSTKGALLIYLPFLEDNVNLDAFK